MALASLTFLVYFMSNVPLVVPTVQITGWVYVDNWFELYFNGQKVATDPINFKPHNAVKIDFSAPDSGLYSFAIWAQDFADNVTGLEPRNDGTCLGDGGIQIKLSDGTVSNSDWKCFIHMEGPYQTPTCSYGGECTNNPGGCNVTYNDYPSCWNETVCEAADSWQSATEYTRAEVGGGMPTQPYECCGLQDVYTQADIENCALIYPNGCGSGGHIGSDVPFIWTTDLNVHNRLICRYDYCVGGGNDCVVEGTTANPTTSAPTTSAPPTTANPTSVSPTTVGPTTASPTTVSPTTMAPTTSNPTTSAPTTASPTTVAPTTASPSTSTPTTAIPTTSNPTSVSPTTSAPVTSPPTSAAPTTASPTTTTPTTAVPTTAGPTTAAPITASPTTSIPITATSAVPTTANPTTSAPTTASPITATPTTSAPTTSAPVTSPPTSAAPTTSNPTTLAPTTASPTTAAPITASPTTSTPTTSNPITAVPTTASPSTSTPTTAAPVTAIPTTANPTTSNPTSVSPTTVGPTTASPTTVSPTTMAPTTANPTTSAPTTSAPVTSPPTSAAPTTSNPTTLAPTTAVPTTLNPTTSNPTTVAPTTAGPTTATPITASPTTSTPTTSAPTTAAPITAVPTSNPTTAGPTTSDYPCLTGLGSCDGLTNYAKYQSCDGCEVYVWCIHGSAYIMPCPGGTVWDDNVKGCVWESQTCGISGAPARINSEGLGDGQTLMTVTQKRDEWNGFIWIGIICVVIIGMCVLICVYKMRTKTKRNSDEISVDSVTVKSSNDSAHITVVEMTSIATE